MKHIIAHRGYWNEEEEQNTLKSFERALSNGFGIETDVRDLNENLVISHNMANRCSINFQNFLELCNEYDHELVLALNIKSDGLQQPLKQSSIHHQHFYFDMSVPDMLGYYKEGMTIYSRYSDIEITPSLYKESSGIWLDNFRDEYLDVTALERFLLDKKKVVLVSPELHKREIAAYWLALKEFISSNPQWSDLIGLCTDYPSKARDYFNDK
ncbi:hypothetical protein [Aliivibrio fischeri]|uniref:hypothetical protein n=1 Tax=Aliivibrio fischeri TaxID=668 RepID=UPI0007C5A8B1|nr:hypothetical protein [Aliivibrio fischeri]